MSVSIKATPAQRLLCSFGDGASHQCRIELVSTRAHVLDAYGYKNFVYEFGENAIAHLQLKATDDLVIEVRLLAAIPYRVGSGSRVMQILCRLADEIGVTLWLNACPFGSRKHIPIGKLKDFYRCLGFFPVKRIDTAWTNGYHRWDRTGFDHPMIRNPQEVSVQSKDGPA